MTQTGDFNNDGNADLATKESIYLGTNRILVFLGDGSGNFLTPTIISISAIRIGYFNFANIDSDNILDMIVVENDLGKLFLFKGTGDGNFTFNDSLDVFGVAAFSVQDVNADGKNDILAASYNNSEVVVYFGDGSFNFSRLSESFGTPGGCYRIISDDFDNDGDLDLAMTTQFGSNSISVLLNQLDVVSVDDPYENTFEPNSFTLYQNYPNPFNPSTSIKYSVKENSLVSLKLYDILGNEVVTLVNEEKPAGEYEIKFNAKGLASGIYFYQLKANTFIETKKMIFLQ